MGKPSDSIVKRMFSCQTEGGRRRVFAQIDIFGNEIRAPVDSGCEQNFIDQATYDKMVTKPSLRTTYIKFKVYFYGNLVENIGEFDAIVKYGNKKCYTRFMESPGGDGCALVVLTSCKLGLFQHEVFSEIVTVASISDGYQGFINDFPSVFSDKIGKLEGYQVKIHINKSIKPLRRLPYN
jgi:hypothetical protein